MAQNSSRKSTESNNTRVFDPARAAKWYADVISKGTFAPLVIHQPGGQGRGTKLPSHKIGTDLPEEVFSYRIPTIATKSQWDPEMDDIVIKGGSKGLYCSFAQLVNECDVHSIFMVFVQENPGDIMQVFFIQNEEYAKSMFVRRKGCLTNEEYLNRTIVMLRSRLKATETAA